jgi:hypothetical protein
VCGFRLQAEVPTSDIVFAMQCPKCGAPHDAGDAECRRCGVVFAKLAQRAGIPDAEPAAVAAPAPPVEANTGASARRSASRAVR